MVYCFPKWCIFKTVDTIKGPPQVRVISFDISRVSSALFRWSISFYGSIIYPLLTCISKLPCFVFMFRYGSGYCLSAPWFRCCYQQKMHSHCYFILLSVGDGFFHIFCQCTVFYSLPGSLQNICFFGETPCCLSHIMHIMLSLV